MLNLRRPDDLTQVVQGASLKPCHTASRSRADVLGCTSPFERNVALVSTMLDAKSGTDVHRLARVVDGIGPVIDALELVDQLTAAHRLGPHAEGSKGQVNAAWSEAEAAL